MDTLFRQIQGDSGGNSGSLRGDGSEGQVVRLHNFHLRRGLRSGNRARNRIGNIVFPDILDDLGYDALDPAGGDET